MPVDDVVAELGVRYFQVSSQGPLDVVVAGRQSDIQITLRDIEAAAFEADVHHGNASLPFNHDSAPRVYLVYPDPRKGCHKKKARTSSKSDLLPHLCCTGECRIQTYKAGRG